MTGPKQLAPPKEAVMQAEAQVITLGRDAPAQSKSSGIERNGAEISINIVVSLGGDNYIKSTLSGDIVAALMQRLQAISGEGRVAFTTTWMSAVKTAVYEKYQKLTIMKPELTSFTYVVPSVDLAREITKTNEFRPEAATMPVIPSKTEMSRDIATHPLKPVTEEDVQLPKGVEGKGTKKAPYVVDLTGRSTATDSLGSIKLVMPAEFDIGLSSAVYVTFVLTTSQLRKMRDESPTGPFISELKSITDKAMARSCKVQGEPYEGDTYSKAEDVLKQLGRKLYSFTNRLQDENVKAYFAK